RSVSKSIVVFWAAMTLCRLPTVESSVWRKLSDSVVRLLMRCRLSFSAFSDSLRDRKSTRLNSSHGSISYAVFCLKKKTKMQDKNNRQRISQHSPLSTMICCWKTSALPTYRDETIFWAVYRRYMILVRCGKCGAVL